MITILLIANFSAGWCIGEDLYFSGRYDHVPFVKFVQDVEQKTGASFFFKTEWVAEIFIDLRGDSMLLDDVLDSVLEGTDLDYYIDDGNNVFIIKNIILVKRLPDFSFESGREDLAEGSSDGVTSTEQKYINGRKASIAETIIVGDKSSGNPPGTAIIHGKLTDSETGEPLIGATIYINELESGSVTDLDGHFTLFLVPGRYSVEFSSMGMKKVRCFLLVRNSGRLDLAMEKDVIPISEVVVKADRYHNVKGLQMGFERITIKSIKEIPLVMGEKDLLKVAQMLPGIQTVGEGTSGFNVRGSPADQNMFYINKIPVYNTSHLFGFFSSFSPDIVRDFSLFKSNIPVKYGGRLASFFDISTRQGNRKKFTARGGVSPITGHLAMEGPIKKDHTSFICSARSTYSDWILERLEDPELRNSNASFHDFAGGINIEPNESNLLKIFGYHSFDKFSLSTDNDYNYATSGSSVNWKHRFTNKLSSDLSAVFGRYRFKTINKAEPVSAYEHGFQIDHYEARTDFNWIPGKKHSLPFGASIIYYRLDRGIVKPWGEESLRKRNIFGKENGIEGVLYIADEFKIFPTLTLSTGFRYSFYGFLGPARVYNYYIDAPRSDNMISDTLSFNAGKIIKFYSGPEFRIALNTSTGPFSSVKMSYNRIRQYLFMLSNTIAISPTDQWKLCDYHIRPPYADQYSVGYYKDYPDVGINTSLEAYYKVIHNVVEYKDGVNFLSSPEVEQLILQGNQTAYGLELMVKKNAGKLNGWISYSYSKSTILVDGMNSWEKINFGKRYAANYDKPHALNVVSNFRFNRRISFSANMVYSTGRPVTYPVSVYYLDDKEILNYSLRNKYRIPDYFRLDFSINLEGNLKSKKLAHSYWMFNIYNLTGRKNAYSVYFRTENGQINGYKMSIFGTQIFTISWNFRFGNYASE